MFPISVFLETGPDTSLAWLFWAVLGCFFLIVLVGWTVSRNNKG